MYTKIVNGAETHGSQNGLKKLIVDRCGRSRIVSISFVGGLSCFGLVRHCFRKVLTMGLGEIMSEYAEKKLQQAIENQHNFKNTELCFDYYRESAFWDLLDNGWDEYFADGVESLFAEYFDQHFGTKFGA